MTFVPAALRRSGYHLGTVSTSFPRRGLCGLPPRRQHSLIAFVSDQPPRVVAELLLKIADDGCTVSEALDLVDHWGERLTPEVLRLTGGDRTPARPLHQVAS
jgi:hypothetical protein